MNDLRDASEQFIPYDSFRGGYSIGIS